MNKPKNPSDLLDLKSELALKGEDVRSLGDLGLFAGEIFESDYRRVDDALSLLNGEQKEIDLGALNPTPENPLLQ